LGLSDGLGKGRRVSGRHARVEPNAPDPVSPSADDLVATRVPRTPRHAMPAMPDQAAGNQWSSPVPVQGHAANRGSGGWVPPGVSVEVAGLVLPGGMLYVGRHLPAARGGAPDPALIDPHLKVDRHHPDWTASSVGYWPSYGDISPGARAAYLTWLAGGRQEPNVPISWPFLFFYGLERRLLVDAAQPGPAHGDVPAIHGEVQRLLDLYGDNRSFRRYAGSFLALIDFEVGQTDRLTPPPLTGTRWDPPVSLRLGLGRYAAARVPVPVEWALAWAHFHPEIPARTPTTRCPEEFQALFRIRFAARHGAGLTVRPGKTTLVQSYQPASAGIEPVTRPNQLPDVFTQAAPGRKLAALVEECTNDLDAYSRYLGKHPGQRDSLPAIALLPPELAKAKGGALEPITAFVAEWLADADPAVIDGSELIAFWPAAVPGRLSKAEAVALAQLLGGQGVGVEPDVRLGGPVLSDGPAVLFRAAPGQPTAPSAGYAAATLAMHLAAAVSAADGVSEAEMAHLRHHLETVMLLTDPERRRLNAHLRWLLVRQMKLSGLAKRLAALDDTQRDGIGNFLITVAAADGVVSPGEITTLTKVFKLLGLDPASVYSRVHVATAGGPPAAGPVTVRPAGDRAPGYAIPPKPSPPDASDRVAQARHDPVVGGVRLDEAVIAAKLTETAAVSALLGGIFAEDTETASTAVSTLSTAVSTLSTAGTDTPPEVVVAGLDGAHSSLLRLLAGRDTWTRAEFEQRCADLELLPDGAIDRLNEAAYDTAGDPLVEGEDPLDINTDVVQEMLA
jgi:uncharacterized tellurite resistance protein B-like protein